MDVGAAEFFCADVLTGCGLYKGRATEEDRALAVHDHGLVRHRWNVGPARRTRPHNASDLGYSRRRQIGLIIENPAEVIAVREDFGLEGQECPAGINEVDARKPILEGDFLSPKVFLDGQGIVGSPLHRRVVREDHAFGPGYPSNPSDDSGPGHRILVESESRKWRDLKKGRLGIEQRGHSIPR